MRRRRAVCARGFEVLLGADAPVRAVAFHADRTRATAAIIVTSADALRGIVSLKGHRLLELPLFAVGEHTAAAARRAGFTR